MTFIKRHVSDEIAVCFVKLELESFLGLELYRKAKVKLEVNIRLIQLRKMSQVTFMPFHPSSGLSKRSLRALNGYQNRK